LFVFNAQFSGNPIVGQPPRKKLKFEVLTMTKQNKNNNPEKAQLKPILHLTEAAVKKIRSMMEKEEKTEHGLRIGVVTGGCAGLSYDLRFQKEPYDNDLVIEQDDLRIFINPESQQFLTGVEVHYVDTLKESGFQYRNPNAQNSCGCGVSFS